MQQIIRVISEGLLATFLVAIVAAATITTVGLSPVVLTPDTKENSVLGVTVDTKNTLRLSDANDVAKLTPITSEQYSYSDTIKKIKSGQVYEKEFITFTNSDSVDQEYSFALNLNNKYQDLIDIELVDPAGNATLLRKERQIKINANAVQSYRLKISSQENINFDVEFSIIVTDIG